MIKNQANQPVAFTAISVTTGLAVTTGTPTVYVTGDNGTQSTGLGTCTHKGNGQWVYVPTQAETNFDHVAYTFTLSGAIAQTVQAYTVGGDAYAAIVTVNANVGLVYTDTQAIINDVQVNIPGSLASQDAAISAIDSVVDAVRVVTDRLDTGLESDGASGYQWTTLALENGPSAGGSGLYQVTVTVQDGDTVPVQGARVNVDGTGLTVTTDVLGQAVLNLNAGSYTLNVSAPSGYEDPAATPITVAGDGSETITVAGSGGSGEVPWVG